MPSTEKIDIVEKKSQGGANFFGMDFFQCFSLAEMFQDVTSAQYERCHHKGPWL